MRRFALVVVAGCWSSTQPGNDPVKPVAAPVDVAIASVKLADDCPDEVADAKAERSMAGDCAQDSDCSFPRVCEQTMLQVSFRSSGSESASVSIKRVELLDANGKKVGTLTARKPTRWAQNGTYITWNQTVAGGELLSASYALSAPDWGALPGGRDPTATYKVRVTFAVGGGEKTVEKQAVVSAFSEPNVVT
jgi:hypothetical protein